MSRLLEINLQRMCLVRVSVNMWEGAKESIYSYWYEYHPLRFGSTSQTDWNEKVTSQVLAKFSVDLPNTIKEELFFIATEMGQKIFDWCEWLVERLNFWPITPGLNLRFTQFGIIDKESTLLHSESNYNKMRFLIAFETFSEECVSLFTKLSTREWESLLNSRPFIKWHIGRQKFFNECLRRPEYLNFFRTHRTVEEFGFRLSLNEEAMYGMRIFKEEMSKEARNRCIMECIPKLLNSGPSSVWFRSQDDRLEVLTFLLEEASALNLAALDEYWPDILLTYMSAWPWSDLVPSVYEKCLKFSGEDEIMSVIKKFIIDSCDSDESSLQQNRFYCKAMLHHIWRLSPDQFKTEFCDWNVLKNFVNDEMVDIANMMLKDVPAKRSTVLKDAGPTFLNIIRQGRLDLVEKFTKGFEAMKEVVDLKEDIRPMLGCFVNDLLNNLKTDRQSIVVKVQKLLIWCQADGESEGKLTHENWLEALEWIFKRFFMDGKWQLMNHFLYFYIEDKSLAQATTRTIANKVAVECFSDLMASRSFLRAKNVLDKCFDDADRDKVLNDYCTLHGVSFLKNFLTDKTLENRKIVVDLVPFF